MGESVVDICKANPTGIVEVRIRKLNRDGSWVYHRTAIEPGVDPKAQMEAVNAHIVKLNAQRRPERATLDGETYFDRDYTEEHLPVKEKDIAKVVEEVTKVQTPEVIAAFRAVVV